MTKRGRPFEPGNTYSRGRPRGSRNKSTVLVGQILEDKDPLMRKGVMMGLQGNVPILKTLLQPLLAGYRGSLAKLGPLPTGTLEEVSKASETVINLAAAGKMSPDDARQFMEMIEGRRRVIETEELAARVRALEESKK